MNQPSISAAGLLELLPNPPDASAAWGAFSVQVMEPPVRAAVAWSEHVVALQLSGTCRLREEICGRSVEKWSFPGCVNVIPAELEGSWQGRDHHGKSRAIAVFVPHAFLSRVIAQDWDIEPGRVEICRRFLVRDPVIESVLTRLAIEAKQGSPSGSIYAESACEFLAHHLIHAHSSLASPPRRCSGGLPARRLKLVLEYIAENLAQTLCLQRLAELAGVSPRHFERAFRQALGVPPHAYVLQKRLAAARELISSQPELSIHEIAIRVGFSSSSHLASAFRRQTGYSPSAFRRLESR